MLDKLIEVVIEFIELFQIFVFVDEFEEGVILRRGRFHRTVKPGMRWLLPLGQEDIIVVNVKPEPMYLDLQSLHTVDGYGCNMQVGVIWRVIDTHLFLIENEDTKDIVGMLCSGVVRNSVQGCKWAELAEVGYPDTLKAPMNRRVRKRGAEIDEVVVQDFAAGAASRIWHEGISISTGED